MLKSIVVLFAVLGLGSFGTHGQTSPNNESTTVKVLGRTVEIKSEPIQINVSEELRQAFGKDPQLEGFFNLLLQMIQPHLKKISSASVDWPASTFSVSDKIISLSDLKVDFDESELIKLAGAKFSMEQLESISKSAQFKVQSLSNPDQFHVYRVKWWFQSGTDHIKASIQSSQASIYKELIIEIPERVLGTISLKDGAIRFLKGFVSLIGASIGNREMSQLLEENEIDRLLANERILFVRKALESHFKAAPDLTFLPEPKDEVAIALLKKISAVAASLQSQAEAAWKLNEDKIVLEIKKRIEQDISNGIISASNASQTLANQIAEAQFALRIKFIEQSTELAALRRDLPTKLVTRMKALKAIAEAQIKDDLELEEMSQQVRIELRNKNPIRSKIASWLEEKVQQKMASEKKERDQNRLTKLVEEILPKLNAYEEAVAFKAENNFEILRKEIEKNLRSRRVPSRVIKTAWINRWEDRIRYDAETQEYFYDLFDQPEVTSRFPAWRVQLFLLRTLAFMRNTPYYLGERLLWNGPFGIRSLISKEKFGADPVVDRKTGDLSWRNLRGTLASNLSAIWSSVNSRAQQVREDHRGGAPLWLKQGMNFAWNTLGIGVGGSAVTIGTHLAIPTVYGIIAAVGIGTSPVWAPSLAALRWAFNIAVFDTEGLAHRLSGRSLRFLARNLHGSISPLLYDTLISKFILGVVEMVGAALAIIAWHPGVSLFEVARMGAGWAKNKYDQALLKVIQRNFTIPAGDAWGFSRISGPGISNQYFYQIPNSLALLAAKASIEAMELNRIKNAVDRLLAEPSRHSEAQLMAIQEAMGPLFPSVNLTGSSVYEVEIRKALQKTSDQLAKQIEQAEKNYAELLNIPNAKQIVFTEPDLEKLLTEGTSMVQTEYENRFATWSSEEIQAFWKSEQVAEGDWNSLFRKILKDVFHENIDSPTHELDRITRIEIKDPYLRQLIASLESGDIEMKEDKTAKIEQAQVFVDKTRSEVFVPEILSTCRTMLSGLAR